jgi:hypothetical protein
MSFASAVHTEVVVEPVLLFLGSDLAVLVKFVVKAGLVRGSGGRARAILGLGDLGRRVRPEWLLFFTPRGECGSRVVHRSGITLHSFDNNPPGGFTTGYLGVAFPVPGIVLHREFS